jgi:DNA-binding XRE family transcriptional regulator
MTYKDDEYYEKERTVQVNSTNYMTQEEVAEALGIKRQAVNNIEKLALRKLKYIIARKYTKEDLI